MIKRAFTLISLVSMLISTGCISNPDDSPITSEEKSLYIFETDYSSGAIGTITLNGDYTQIATVNSDAVIREYSGDIYVLERSKADNLVKMDKNGNVEYQIHIKDNWNPHDIQFLSPTKAYISSNNVAEIYVLDPSKLLSTDKELVPLKKIDISQYTFNPDSNSSPNASKMALVGNTLYVSLQLRNGYNPGGASKILVINTETDSIVKVFQCLFKNAYDMIAYNNALYVVNVGSFFDSTDGAIEKINLITNTVSTVVTGAELTADPAAVQCCQDGTMYIQIAKSWMNSTVVKFDPTNKTSTILNGISFANGITYDQEIDKLFVLENSADNFGVMIFNNGILEKMVKTTLPPANSVLMGN